MKMAKILGFASGLFLSVRAEAAIQYDVSPGSNAPPATLGPYLMHPFGADVRDVQIDVFEVPINVPNIPAPLAATNVIQLDVESNHYRYGDEWMGWSHNHSYGLDVYYAPTAELVITLPPGANAFYFYVSPSTESPTPYGFKAIAGEVETPEVIIPDQLKQGANYFGFYTTDPVKTPLTRIRIINTLGNAGGFAVGEFGIGVIPDPGRGFLTITLQGAEGAGAQWRVENGFWQDSGTTLELTAGSHNVEFKEVAGWQTPASQTVTVHKGETTSSTGLYFQPKGILSVTMDPQAAADAGAQWRADGGDWQINGATVELIAGSHWVEVSTVLGWDAPPNQSVTIEAGQTVNLVVSMRAQKEPVIRAQPQSLGTPEGASVTFNVAATGAPPLHYQWQFNGQTLVGQTNAILTLAQVNPFHSGEYRAVVSNELGTAVSAAANLAVYGDRPWIVSIRKAAPNSATELLITTQPGQTINVDVSYDLVQWTLLRTQSADATGRLSVIDLESIVHPRQFYRASAP